MILVDTSAWIDFLNKNDTAPAAALDEIMARGAPFGITSVIYQELLQGTATERDFEKLDLYLRTQRFYHPKDPLVSYASAASVYARCRRAGVTPRSTIDCLIAQIAIEHNLLLLHNDRDFARISGVIPELKLYESFEG